MLNVREPDRVPVNLPVGNLPLKMFGVTSHDAMYNPEKAYEAAAKFNAKYGVELETNAMPWSMPGKVYSPKALTLYQASTRAWRWSLVRRRI